MKLTLSYGVWVYASFDKIKMETVEITTQTLLKKNLLREKQIFSPTALVMKSPELPTAHFLPIVAAGNTQIFKFLK